ncbi:late competence development ComFB family protein [Paludicola sp. MB14-C6]|uniref:late competence development ComFB family protein n=1 Tax=Paludihabitans sp. MB14-C6 TaxID=3070656 RepID=UPI0027DB9081|nr:late competence development ComFB family protein [Paludicola sp. MB14-C6]WMJ21948.1 late competence development ComFB family protein [Paludicola sp. MB14-C6]
MEKELLNMMEPLVLQKLDEIIGKFDCCSCDKCKMDIASYALNLLPPKYVATHKGGVFVKLNESEIQNETDLIACITKAIQVVSKNPKHNPFI